MLPVVALANGRFYTPPAGDKFFSKPLPRSTPLATQCVVDMRDLIAKKMHYPLEMQPDGAALAARRQHSDAWFRDRVGNVTGSALSKFAGWAFGGDEAAAIWGARDQVWEEWEAEKRGVTLPKRALVFEDERREATASEAMAWGTANELNGLATFKIARPTLVTYERTLMRLPYAPSERFSDSQDGAGVAPDGTTREDGMPGGTRFSLEVKCRYGAREPDPYTGVKDYYVLQMLLHCEVEDSERCYFVCWTPTRTRVWLVPRSRDLWRRVAAYVADILAAAPWTLREATLLGAAAEVRRECAVYARACKELVGSPFDSCFALRNAAGQVLGVDGVME